MAFLDKSDGTRVPSEEGSRFWVCDLDDSIPEHAAGLLTFGPHTVGIVDEEEGGIVLYIHEDNALRLMDAMRAFTGED